MKVTNLPAPAIPWLFPGTSHTPQPCHVLVTSLTLPQLLCLPLGASAAPTARIPSLPNDHCTEGLGAQPVVAQSNFKAGLSLFAPGRSNPRSSCCSDLPHSMSPWWWGEKDTCDAPQCFVTPALLPKLLASLSLQVMSQLMQQPACLHSQPWWGFGRTGSGDALG